MPDTDNLEPPAHKKHVPPESLSRLDEQALQARLKAVEQDFYWIRHGRPAETRLSHQELEREWNDLKASIALKQGKDWVYKHDHRDRFTFDSTTKQVGTRQRMETLATGTIHDPETTIHWRSDTVVGAARFEKIRDAAVARGELKPGDDLGHLVADEWGVDPEGVNRGELDYRNPDAPIHRRNYTSQNRDMNRYRAWRWQEADLTAAARIAPVKFDMRSSAAARFGPSREIARSLNATQLIGGEIRQLATNKLSFGNWERNGAPIDMSLVRAHRARNLRAQSFKQLLNIERQTLVIERTTALVQRRLDELPMNHPRRIPLQAKLNSSEQKRLQLQASSETARQEYSRATRLFHARVNKLPAEEQRALRQAILERETTLALRLSGKTDSPTTRAGMQTLLAVNAERRVSAGTAAVDAFRTAYAADLSKPVHERILMPGEKLVRYAHPTARLGQSYTTPGTAAVRSGISPEVARPRQTYLVRHQVKALEFTTAPTVDTWTLRNSQGKSLGSYTGSGATEIRIPRESVNRALKKMPRAQASKSGTVILQKGKLRQFASKTRAKRPSSTLRVRKPKA